MSYAQQLIGLIPNSATIMSDWMVRSVQSKHNVLANIALDITREILNNVIIATDASSKKGKSGISIVIPDICTFRMGIIGGNSIAEMFAIVLAAEIGSRFNTQIHILSDSESAITVINNRKYGYTDMKQLAWMVKHMRHIPILEHIKSHKMSHQSVITKLYNIQKQEMRGVMITDEFEIRKIKLEKIEANSTADIHARLAWHLPFGAIEIEM